MSDTTPLRIRRESSGLVYNLVVVSVVWNNFCFLVWLFTMTVISSFWRCLFVGISLLTWPKTWPVGIDHCSVCYCFHGKVSKYAADLRHCLETNLSAEKCVTAINICLARSNYVYTCLRRKTYQMRTRELHYCKELGTCVGCLCMLTPKYAVCSRDECVVFGVITGKESSTKLY